MYMLTSCMAGWQCSSRHHNKDQESNGHGPPCVAQVDSWCHEEKGQLIFVCLSSLCCSGVLLCCQELLWFVFIEAQSYLGYVAHMISCIYYLHYFLINPKKIIYQFRRNLIFMFCIYWETILGQFQNCYLTIKAQSYMYILYLSRDLFSVNTEIANSQSRHNQIFIFCIYWETIL